MKLLTFSAAIYFPVDDKIKFENLPGDKKGFQFLKIGNEYYQPSIAWQKLQKQEDLPGGGLWVITEDQQEVILHKDYNQEVIENWINMQLETEDGDISSSEYSMKEVAQF